ncbi:hypothetical protein NQ317_010774 [Molorchus minor]|uniref:Uncharacterized protein n=1 Tax=Molorchus minor TaxID=1323400 RepID=A0ABQ9J9H8_9CUCU|nr:hypothetical protein NQ317_010774 [Molorchus minor]
MRKTCEFNSSKLCVSSKMGGSALWVLLCLFMSGTNLGSSACHHKNAVSKSGKDASPEAITPLDVGYSVDEHVNEGENFSHIECTCALFTSQFPLEDVDPLISKRISHVSCHDQELEEDVCARVCIGFVLTYYRDKDDIICVHARNMRNITVFLHSKVNGKSTGWNYTGMSTAKPLCCEDGEKVQC